MGDAIPSNPGAFMVLDTVLIDRAACDRLIESATPASWSVVTAEQNDADGSRARLVEQQDLPGSAQIVLDRILQAVSSANAEVFGFALEGLAAHDQPTLMRYTESTGGRYDWHVDAAIGSPTRKVSFSLQLSDADDYDGGELEFYTGPATRQQGSLILFPSYLSHRVLPVTRGARHVVVGWVHGPTFQ